MEDVVTKGRQRTVARYPHLADLPDRGPVAEMLLARGWPLKRVVSIVETLSCEGSDIERYVTGREAMARFRNESAVIIREFVQRNAS